MNNPNMDSDGKVWKWSIEPHPYDSDYDAMVTDDDNEARDAIMYAAEMFLWDGNDGDDDGPNGPTRILKVTHNAGAVPRRGSDVGTSPLLGQKSEEA